MTAHKSQSQTLNLAIVDLGSEAFAHGALLVAVSRTRHAADLKSFGALELEKVKFRVNDEIQDIVADFHQSSMNRFGGQLDAVEYDTNPLSNEKEGADSGRVIAAAPRGLFATGRNVGGWSRLAAAANASRAPPRRPVQHKKFPVKAVDPGSEEEAEVEVEEVSENSSDVEWIPADIQGPARVGVSQFDIEEAPRAQRPRAQVLGPGVPNLRPARDNVRGFSSWDEF
jgi:hypothetical protein